MQKHNFPSTLSDCFFTWNYKTIDKKSPRGFHDAQLNCHQSIVLFQRHIQDLVNISFHHKSLTGS